MAAMTDPPPRGIIHRIIATAAERLAQHADIPDGSREAFRLTAVHVIEQQICDIIGCDTVRLSGWTIAPSERQARRERILQALQRGEPARRIASRELVSERTVFRLAAALRERDECQKAP